jgi:hypothetical protein
VAVPEAEEVTTPAEFIAHHQLDYAGIRCGVVELGDKSLTVCSGWWKPDTGKFGWRVERIENTRQAVREWLGY